MPKPRNNRLEGLVDSIRKIKAVHIVLILNLVVLYLLINPLNLSSQLKLVQVVNQVSALVNIPQNQISVVAQVGDNVNLPGAEELKKQNSFNNTVYANAENGDYAIGYSNRLVIYRQGNNSIIYNGLNPNALQEQTVNAVLDGAIKAAKEQGLVPADSEEVPQYSFIAEEQLIELKKQDGFYNEASVGDAVLVFSNAKKIVIYNPQGAKIIKSANFNTVIK